MQFNGLGGGGACVAMTSLRSRAALAAGAAVIAALTFAAPGGALAQCAGSYHATSGTTSVHTAVNPNAGVYTGSSGTTAGSTSSCPTGGTATNNHVVHANLGGVDRPTVHSRVASRSNLGSNDPHPNLSKTASVHKNLKTHP